MNLDMFAITTQFVLIEELNPSDWTGKDWWIPWMYYQMDLAYSRFQRSNTPSRGEYRKLPADGKDRASTLK